MLSLQREASHAGGKRLHRNLTYRGISKYAAALFTSRLLRRAPHEMAPAGTLSDRGSVRARCAYAQRMRIEDDELREFKTVVFDGGQSPNRALVQFLHDAMRWPVDGFATHTEPTADRQGIAIHRVVWLKGRLVGEAKYAPDGKPEITVSVRTTERLIHSVITPHSLDQGFDMAIVPSLTMFFDDGSSIILNPAAMAHGWQRDRAAAFTAILLDELNR